MIFAVLGAGGVHLGGGVVGELQVQPQLVALPGLRQIADGELPQGVGAVELAGQQVRDPVHAAGVVHVAVAVQVGKGHGSGLR